MEPLAAAEDLACHLQRDLDRASADLALAGASGLVRRHAGWPISESTETLTRLGGGSVVLGLPTLMLTAVTEVRVGTEVIAAAELAAAGYMGAEEYTWTPEGQLIRPAGWPRLAQVQADCTHGYDPVPDDVRLVTLTLAGRLLANPEALKSKTVGGISRTYGGSSDLGALETALLDGYRLP